MHQLFHKGSAETVIAAAIEVHRDKGPGLIESIQEWCWVRERSTGTNTETEEEIPGLCSLCSLLLNSDATRLRSGVLMKTETTAVFRSPDTQGCFFEGISSVKENCRAPCAPMSRRTVSSLDRELHFVILPKHAFPGGNNSVGTPNVDGPQSEIAPDVPRP
jgi:hypothetical protein